MQKGLVDNISIALNYIENAYNTLKYRIDNEDRLTDKERTELYEYGIDLARLNLVRICNAKKGLLSVTGKMRKIL